MTRSTAVVRRHAALPNIANAELPVAYANAKTALAKCNRLDECKEWANKAMALASYAKQADDDSLQRMALRIKARAIRRCGELLKTFKAPGGRPSKTRAGAGPSLSQREAAKGAGMSKRQEKQAVRVANVPAPVFDAVVESERPPTVGALAEMGTTPANPPRDAPPGFALATHAIGRLKDLAIFCGEHPPDFIAAAIYDYEAAKVKDHALTIETWLAEFVRHLRTEVQ
jgi:hypothetical protein